MSKCWIGKLMAAGLIFVLLLQGACTSPPLGGESPLTVMGCVSQSALEELVEARLVLSRGKHVVEEVVPLEENEFQAQLELPVGEWELSVLLIDAQGMAQFQSTPQTVQIITRQPSVINLILRPANSEVKIMIDLEDYIFRNLVYRARIHFNEEIYEIIREDNQTPLEAELSIGPGSYEFMIELYTASFRVGDRLGPGIWEILDVPVQGSLSISWSPLAAQLQIEGRVERMLSAPENVKLEAEHSGITISWDPVPAGDVAGYFVFSQESPLERFKMLNPIPLTDTSFYCELDPEETGEFTCFIAAAVSPGGLVGYYSEPIYLHPH